MNYSSYPTNQRMSLYEVLTSNPTGATVTWPYTIATLARLNSQGLLDLEIWSFMEFRFSALVHLGSHTTAGKLQGIISAYRTSLLHYSLTNVNRIVHSRHTNFSA